MRDRATIQPRFFDTYHYADVIANVLENPMDHLQLREDFFCDDAVLGLVAPYERDSAFHAFIRFVIDRLLYDYTNEFDLEHAKRVLRALGSRRTSTYRFGPFALPVEQAMAAYGIECESFVRWLKEKRKKPSEADADDIYGFFVYLREIQQYDDLITASCREVFFLLFANRSLLLDFNTTAADRLRVLEPRAADRLFFEEVAHHFERPGVLRRARMPKWVRRAVYFRDRGRCVACQVDLSGTVSLLSEENYDHMVPLAIGGLNDVTNIQLLCARCNKRKADGAPFTTALYEDWYEMSQSRMNAGVPPPGSAAEGSRPISVKTGPRRGQKA
jgi:hypothetical protein